MEVELLSGIDLGQIVAVALSGIKFFSRKRGKVNAAFLPLAIVSFFAVSDVALRDPLIHAIVNCNLGATSVLRRNASMQM